MKKLTIAVPFLNEEENLSKFEERILEIRKCINEYIVEFLFIDDGSFDASFDIVFNLSQKIENIKILRFSKNYGSHYALFAAIDHTSDSEYFTFMSSDMQEPIQLYVDMINVFSKDQHFDILFADRLNRNTDAFNKFFSTIYNKMVAKFAIKDFPNKGVDAFMFNNKVLKALQNMNIKNTSIYGNLFNVGFNKGFVPYGQLSRVKGVSKWTFSKKVKLFIDTFISFSLVPLRLITILGIVFSTVGFLYGLYILYAALSGAIKIEGWSTIVALNTFGFGLIFLMIGIVSEYIWRIYDQINPNKSYVIKEKIGFDK